MKSTRILAALLLSLIAVPHSRSEPEPEGPAPLYNVDLEPCCPCLRLTVGDGLTADTKGNYKLKIYGQVDTAKSPPDCSKVIFLGPIEIIPGGYAVVTDETLVGKQAGYVEIQITPEKLRQLRDHKVHKGSLVLTIKCSSMDNPPPGQSETSPDLKRSNTGCAIKFRIEECGKVVCESCTTGPPVTESECFVVTIPTTPSSGGMTAGNLLFRANDFTNPGRAALVANLPSDFTVLQDANDLITSIDTGAATLEVADADPALFDLDPNAFTVTHKDLTGTDFRSTTISLVTEAGIARFRMDSDFDNTITRHEQTQPAAGTLVLEKGRLVGGTTFEPLWQETLVKNESTPGVRIYRRTIKERPTAASAWAVSSDIETTEERQIYGWVLTKQIIDPSPGGAQLTSTWTYYQPGEITGPGGSTEGLSRLKSHIRHDGYQSFHTYSLNQTTVATPFLGDPAGNVTTSIWNPITNTQTTTTTLNGVLIGKTVTAHTPTTFARTVHTAANETLITTTHYVPSGQDFGGKPTRIIHPDGTLTTYAYTREIGGGYVTVTENGATTDDTTVSMGTRTITTTNSRGTTILREVTAIGHGTGATVFERTAVTEVDNLGRALTTAHFPTAATVVGEQTTANEAKWTTTTTYSCCGIARETDQFGVPTYHAYDHLQRRIKSNTLGVTTEIVRLGLTTETHRYPDPVAVSLNSAFNGNEDTLIARSSTNLSGTEQNTWSPDPTSDESGTLILSSTTLTEFAPDVTLSRRTTTTVPGGHSQLTDTYLDGRTYQTTGALSPAMAYAYIPNATGLLSLQAYLVGDDYYEATATQSDWAGRTTHSGAATPGTGLAIDLEDGTLGQVTNYLYNSLGQLKKTIDPDDVTTLHAYNTRGERTTTAVKLDAEETITYGIDQVTFSETVPALDGTDPIWVTTNKVWYKNETDQLIESTVSTSTRTPDGLFSSTQTIGIGNPSTTLTTIPLDGVGDPTGSWTTTNTNPDGTYSVTTYTDGLMDIIENFDSEEDLISSISIRDATNDPLSGYDGLKRPIHQRDSRTGVTTTVYLSDTADFVARVEDPSTPPRITSFTYDTRGRRTHVDAPDTPNPAGGTHDNITITAYNPDSTILSVTGDQTYAVTYTYDYADRMKTMLTSGAQSATTTWKYTEDRGFLWRKEYQGGNGTSYTHTAAGRLKTRTWQRGVLTTYDYDNAGRLETVIYSNETNGHTTPNLSYAYDALGRIKTVTRGDVVDVEYTYRASDLQRLAETQQIDSLNQTVTYTYETAGTGTLAGRPSGYTFSSGSAIWSYDSAGRLGTVGDGTETFTYGYRYDQTTATDPRIGNTSGTKQDFMPYTLTGPKVTTTLAYEADRNALLYRQNGLSGGILSKFTYSVNDLGQRASLTPTGSAFAVTTPITWGYNHRGELTNATRTGSTEFERAYSYDDIGNRLTATNHTGATTNYFADTLATTPGGNALNQYAKINYPGIASIQPVHDTDGNLTSGPVPGEDGLNPGVPVPSNATLKWDAENRLVKAEVNSITVDYDYDHQSRLVARTEGTVTTRYLYDGWNRIAEYQETTTGHDLKVTYLWGMDMSGSMQGAGGVGGLLAIRYPAPVNGSTYFYPTYDGNGNVSEYVNDSGDEVAHFEYDPFGNLTVDSESNAEEFPYRFSTKPQDLTTGLYYYGYRWYDPATGRWPSRDPIEEQGGVNLYEFVGNDTTNQLDYLGLRNLSGMRLMKLLAQARNQIKDSPFYDISGLESSISKLEKTYRKWWLVVDVYYQSFQDSSYWNPITNNMILNNLDPLNALHESVHMFNDLSNPYRMNEGDDEGMAYAIESVYNLTKAGNSFKFLFTDRSCDVATKLSSAYWKSMWDDYQFSGSMVYDNSMDKPLKDHDFRNLRWFLGAKFSCVKSAEILNSSPVAQKCCLIFSCEKGPDEKIGEYNFIKLRNEIHASLK